MPSKGPRRRSNRPKRISHAQPLLPFGEPKREELIPRAKPVRAIIEKKGTHHSDFVYERAGKKVQTLWFQMSVEKVHGSEHPLALISVGDVDTLEQLHGAEVLLRLAVKQAAKNRAWMRTIVDEKNSRLGKILQKLGFTMKSERTGSGEEHYIYTRIPKRN